MRNSIILLLAVCVAAACNKNKNFLYNNLSPSNLRAQTFVINTNRDTVIHTTGGAIITIAANSISAERQSVSLQVKDPYNITDMIAAGLFTETKEGLLSSGGMINITTREPSIISKPVSIQVLARSINRKMQLYKGEEEDGKIAWKDPSALQTKASAAAIDGKALFAGHCASCHAIDKELTGPALAHVTKRRPAKWLYAFTRDNQQVIKSGDRYACCIYNKYNKTQMNLFPNLGLKKNLFNPFCQ